jgi:hypothetical protein
MCQHNVIMPSHTHTAHLQSLVHKIVAAGVSATVSISPHTIQYLIKIVTPADLSGETQSLNNSNVYKNHSLAYS